MQILNIIDDKEKMLSLAEIAKIDSSNFTKKNFEDRLSDYLAFHTATYKDEVVAMAGMYQSPQWHPKLVRICDRTYYFKKARSGALSFLNNKELKATASDYFIPLQTKIALEKGLIPFYSIYGEKRRRALERQVKRFNEKNTYQYKILSGMYFTCPGPINEKEQCRQNISILDTPDNIVFDLPRLQPQQNMK
jgi:hypothetical protein